MFVTRRKARARSKAVAEDSPRLEILETAGWPKWRGRVFQITEAGLSIGRSELCDLYFSDHSVSRRQCEIRWVDGHAVIIDLNSTNGTFVNGFCFPSKVLVHGDLILIGCTKCIYLDHPDIDEDLQKRAYNFKYEPTRPTARMEAYKEAEHFILRAFANLNVFINTTPDADHIQARVLDLICQVVPVQRAAILLAGHQEDRFVSRRYRTIPSGTEDAFSLDEALALRVLGSRKPIDNRQEGTLCHPMMAFGRKVGVIYTVLPLPDAAKTDPYPLSYLDSIAGFTASALEHARYIEWLEGEYERLTNVIHAEHGMIGRSAKMNEVNEMISRIGPIGRPVLITGATGTGKELAAHAIHRNSSRSGKPFVTVNCGALPGTLLESELFGHEKGAFTGATGSRKGLFETANGGTIFLDEIGELPLAMQPVLLRVLQSGEVRRVGGSQSFYVDVRVIAATNRDLEREIAAKHFREDLFFRLNVMALEMPPLSERREDIPLLAAHFVKKFQYIRTNAGRPQVLGITPEAHHLLTNYSWPGNIRQLEHALESAVSWGTSAYIRPEDLPKILRAQNGTAHDIGTFEARFEKFQRELFEETLVATNWKFAEAARLLGRNPKYFYELCKELGIKRP
jgi:two-component system, NtrC family, response regulator HydG